MRALVSSSALLFAMHVPRLLRARRTLIVLILALGPAVIAWLASHLAKSPSPGELASNAGWLLILQVVVPLTGLVLGSAAVAEEVDDRTLTYLFTRPMPRAALLLGRFAAIAVVLTAILLIGVALFLLAASRARGEGEPLVAGIARPLLCATLLGGVVYAALAAALGAFVKHPMIVGLGYAFAIEGFLANLPGRNQLLTVQHHLRSWVAASGEPAWGRVESFQASGLLEGGTALVVLASITIGALVLGSWRLSRREFVMAA